MYTQRKKLRIIGLITSIAVTMAWSSSVMANDSPRQERNRNTQRAHRDASEHRHQGERNHQRHHRHRHVIRRGERYDHNNNHHRHNMRHRQRDSHRNHPRHTRQVRYDRHSRVFVSTPSFVFSWGHQPHHRPVNRRWIPGCYRFETRRLCDRGEDRTYTVRVWVPGHWVYTNHHRRHR